MITGEFQGRASALVHGQGEKDQVQQVQGHEHAHHGQGIPPGQAREAPEPAQSRRQNLPDRQGEEEDAGVQTGKGKTRPRRRGFPAAQENSEQDGPDPHRIGKGRREHGQGGDNKDIIHRHPRAGTDGKREAPRGADQERKERDEPCVGGQQVATLTEGGPGHAQTSQT